MSSHVFMLLVMSSSQTLKSHTSLRVTFSKLSLFICTMRSPTTEKKPLIFRLSTTSQSFETNSYSNFNMKEQHAHQLSLQFFAISFKLPAVFISATKRPLVLKIAKQERLPEKLQKHHAKLWSFWWTTVTKSPFLKTKVLIPASLLKIHSSMCIYQILLLFYQITWFLYDGNFGV